ncbi:hypothetical protein CsSME_00041088 [Camellia sinensis var. sinensis]
MLSRVTVPTHQPGIERSYFQDFILNGIKIDRIDPGFVVCSFKVPHRFTDRTRNLAPGAIVNLVDELGGTVIYVEGLPMNVSVDMSVSLLSTAKLTDELEITSRVLGQRGGCSGTIILIRYKATGKVVAEGRHSLLSKHTSKL